MKKGVLLVNLGTPDSPSTANVRKYLSEFLNDPRVIDIAFLSRLFLVNVVIVPFRAPKSAKLYREIWTEEGSPLLLNSILVKDKLQEELGEEYIVDFGMRYQKPSIADALARLKEKNIQNLKIIPLYPQYASSSTGSTIQKIIEIISKWEVIPSFEVVSQFYDNPGFIDSWIAVASGYRMEAYEHIVFSFHGLPERQIKKADKTCTCLENASCCDSINPGNYYCYRAASFETARELARRLNIPQSKYTVSFQSRLGKDPWIKPYSDQVIIQKAKEGVKKLLVFSPAFVADCLETTYEIGTEYLELFREHGGEELQLVESLNAHPVWVDTLKKMVVK